MPRGRTDQITRARASLWQAIDKCCIARGEAQWMNGYRTGKFSVTRDPQAEDNELYAKEMARFRVCEDAEARLERCLTRFVRIVRDNKPTKQPRRRTR